MPWNDSSDPGPKSGQKPPAKSGPKPNPWGSPAPDETPPPAGERKPRSSPPPKGPKKGPGVPPPDFNDMSRQASERLKRFFGGPAGRGVNPRAVAMAGAGVVGLWLLTGVYIVQPNEQAVVTTFRAFTGTAGPGLRYHLPAPIQSVQKVNVTALELTSIGGASGVEAPEESLMLTGDENIVDLDFNVSWRVSNAPKFVFNLSTPKVTIKDVAESAMREVVGRSVLQDILTTRRGQIQTETAELMQRTLDAYGAGVNIVEIQIRNASPPTEVVAAFQEVATAEQNAESAVNVANGEAARIRQGALGYRAQVVQEAAGEAARFNQVYDQYRLAPAVTRERLYIETMERVLAKSNKVVIDSKGASAPIILPPDVFKPRIPTQTGVAATGAAQ
jgi:membrane protease subunit HflK